MSKAILHLPAQKKNNVISVESSQLNCASLGKSENILWTSKKANADCSYICIWVFYI